MTQEAFGQRRAAQWIRAALTDKVGVHAGTLEDTASSCRACEHDTDRFEVGQNVAARVVLERKKDDQAEGSIGLISIAISASATLTMLR